MYKKLCFILIGALFSSTLLAGRAGFTGFYGSLNLGYLQAQISKNIGNDIMIMNENESINFSEETSVKSNIGKLTGGLGLGYSGVLKERFLVGLEGRANFENLTASTSWGHKADLGGLALAENNNVTLNDDFELLLKLGVLMTPKALIYGVVGPSWGYFKTFSDLNLLYQPGGFADTGDPHVKNNDYETGWLTGLGMEYLVTDYLSLSFEYTHADYGDINFPNSTPTTIYASGVLLPESSIVDTHTASVKTNNITLRATYYIH